MKLPQIHSRNKTTIFWLPNLIFLPEYITALVMSLDIFFWKLGYERGKFKINLQQWHVFLPCVSLSRQKQLVKGTEFNHVWIKALTAKLFQSLSTVCRWPFSFTLVFEMEGYYISIYNNEKSGSNFYLCVRGVKIMHLWEKQYFLAIFFRSCELCNSRKGCSSSSGSQVEFVLWKSVLPSSNPLFRWLLILETLELWK